MKRKPSPIELTERVMVAVRDAAKPKAKPETKWVAIGLVFALLMRLLAETRRDARQGHPK
jgi:hypothetical protein